MITYKSKSLKPDKVSDIEIKNGCHATRFISFEAVVRQFEAQYKINEQPIGYRVTEQGVEIIYE